MTLIEFPLIKLPNQPPEKYYGNREYKIFLDSNYKKKNIALEKKATQMLFRIHEGKGIAKYIVGVSDNGDAIGINELRLYYSLINLIKIVSIIKANITKIRFYKGKEGFIFVAHVFRNIDNFDLDF